MSNENNFVKEITNIDEDFAQWFTDIVIKADLADYTEVKGFIAYKPYGWAIWENIRNYEDQEFKKRGVENIQLPILMPEHYLTAEKEHVEGFAPEVAWVTQGGGKDLEERLYVRPTSEPMFCRMFAKWLNSYRDLPMKYNQWCNVIRWEKETRPILRSREFHWQEGHTIHATEEEARALVLEMLDVYADVIENYLAIPVVKGQKTNLEKFAGAVDTYTVETLMHDGRSIQAGTSHYLGQNFTKIFGVKYQTKEGKEEYPHHTSWGTSTRLMGALIMAHGDNRGLKLPPRVAPIQAVIVPIQMQKEGVVEATTKLYDSLKDKFRMKLDDRDQYSPGYKFNDWEMKGVPVRIEIGPRDIENGEAVLVRRDTLEKETVKLTELNDRIEKLLDEIQINMYNQCKARQEDRTTVAHSLDEMLKQITEKQGFIKTMWCGDVACEDKIKEVTGAHSRCMPYEQEHLDDVCPVCGKKATKMVIWGRQY